MALYEDQEVCVQSCVAHIESGDLSPAIAVAPTGYGKTYVISELVKRIDGNVLILHLSGELLSQNYEKYTETGASAGIYSASLDSKKLSGVTFATLKSVKRAVEELMDFNIQVVLIDECDRNFNPTATSEFMKFIRVLKPKSVIGFTATPWMLTTAPLGMELRMLTRLSKPYFKKFIYMSQIQSLTALGRWATIEYECFNFDRSKLVLNTTGSEYTEESVLQQNKEQGVNRNMALAIKKSLASGVKSILVFVDSIENVEKFAAWCPNSAAITQATPKKERARIVADFKSGTINVVFNYGVLGVGFNFPGLQEVMFGRSTNSLSIYYQIFGRLVRITDQKTHGKYYDFGGNTFRFGKVEDLVIHDDTTFGLMVMNTGKVLTGFPLHSKYSLKELHHLKAKASSLRGKIQDVRFWFGKNKGKPLFKIPLHYLLWWTRSKKISECSEKEKELMLGIEDFLITKLNFNKNT